MVCVCHHMMLTLERQGVRQCWSGVKMSSRCQILTSGYLCVCVWKYMATNRNAWRTYLPISSPFPHDIFCILDVLSSWHYVTFHVNLFRFLSTQPINTVSMCHEASNNVQALKHYRQMFKKAVSWMSNVQESCQRVSSWHFYRFRAIN